MTALFVRNGQVMKYILAILAVGVAFVASDLATPYLSVAPWIFFFAAVMASAWYGGVRPSLLATFLLLILGRYFFMKPFRSFSLNSGHLGQVGLFVGLSLTIGFLISAWRRAQIHERAERRRFRATVMSIGDAVIAVDAESKVSFMNGIAEELTGWTRKDARGKPLEDIFVIVHEATGELISNPVRDVLQTGRIQGLGSHAILIAKEGRRRPIDDSAAPIKNDKGETIGVVLVFRDVSEQRKADSEHRRLTERIASQARRFDTALSNAADLIYTFSVDGCFTYANQSLLDLLQREAGEVIGKNFHELNYPVDLSIRLQEQIQAVVDTKRRISDETLFTSAFGTRYYEYIFVPVLGLDGEVEAVAGTTRDITERKEAEEATRKRAVQFQKLAEIASRIHSAHDVDSVVRIVTEEARELIGVRQSAISMLPDADHPEPINIVSTGEMPADTIVASDINGKEFYETVQDENGAVRLSQEEVGRDPRWRKLEKIILVIPSENGWLAAPIISRDGKNLGLIQLADKLRGPFSAEDEAILVQLSRLAAIAVQNAKHYDELRTNDKRKDEFLAMLAHELRNPLAAIGNAVKVAVKSQTKSHVEWSMEVVVRQTRHLTRLIDDLLDVSRINRGKIELQRAVLDASPILESALATVRPLILERKHELEVSIDHGNLWVNADATRVEQVVVNLLNNAAKYSENCGRIQLFASNENNFVVITVKDRGVGISADKLLGMFDLFTQGDRSLARSEGGLGIGLTIVKRIAEMHGGSVTASSDGVGRGSTFAIHLPAAPRPAHLPEGISKEIELGDKKSRILVVDDNVDTASGMVRLLGLLGQDVAMAQDGLQALKVAQEFCPQIVLLDIGLPGMDGYEVASRLRQEGCCKNAVLVAVSGYGQEDDRRRSKAAGFDHHLLKPLDQDALLSLLGIGR